VNRLERWLAVLLLAGSILGAAYIVGPYTAEHYPRALSDAERADRDLFYKYNPFTTPKKEPN
jgi:hypothetical protein